MLCAHFKTDTVVVVGSQAILASWPDAPPLLRRSGEIDAYPLNFKQWEALHVGAEASEEVNALFGHGSDFHRAHGFYIDGVDDTTASLPADWLQQAVRRPVVDGEKTLFAVTPDLHDLVVAKLCRLDEKDRAFVEELQSHRRLDADMLLQRLSKVPVEHAIAERAAAFIRGLRSS